MKDSAQDLYAEARELFDNGNLLEAKERLLLIDLSELDLAERNGVLELVDKVDTLLQQMPVAEVRLRRAAVEIKRHDLRSAGTHLQNVISDTESTDDQISRANQYLERIATEQNNLKPHIPTLMADARQAFADGDYVMSKLGFLTVYNSGVPLTLDQQREFNSYLDKIYVLEANSGTTYDADKDVIEAMWAITEVEAMDSGDAVVVTTAQDNNVKEVTGNEQNNQPVMETDVQPVKEITQDTVVKQDEAVTEDGYVPPVDLIYQAQQAQASEYLQQAIDAQNEGRYQTAIDLYTKVLTIQPDNKMATEGKQECETLLNRGTISGRVTQDIPIRAEQLRVEFNNLLEQSQGYVLEGEYTSASRMVIRAQTILGNGRNLLNQDEYEMLRDQALQAGEDIEQQRRAAESAEALVKAQQIEETRKIERENIELKRQRQIAETLAGIRRLQAAQKYDEALLELKSLLFMDPGNPAAQALHDTIEEILLYRRFNKLEKDQRKRAVENSLTLKESMGIPVDIVEYPEDWPIITQTRLGGLAYLDSDEDRTVMDALASRKINVNFANNELGNVLDYIAEVAGINMDVDWKTLEDNFIDRHTTVNMKLNDKVSLKVVLDRVLRQVGNDEDTRPQYAISDGILTISTKEKLQANPVTHVYDIRDLLINIPNFVAPDMDLSNMLERDERSNMSDRLFGENESDEDYDNERLTREERIENIRTLLTTHIDRRTWEINGGDVGVIQELNGNLIITTTPRNHRDISNLLEKLREIRSLQISVESRFLLVSEDFFEQIGFDMDIWWGGSAWDRDSQQDPNLLMSDMFFNKETGEFEPQAQRNYFSLYELRGTVDANGNPIINNGRQGIEGVLPEAGFFQQGRDTFTPQSLQQDTLGLTESLFGAEATSFAGKALLHTPGLTYAVSYLDEIQVDLLIKATQADRRSVSLTSPKLTFFNGQRAFVQLTTVNFYVSDLTPIVGDSAVGFDPTLNAVQDGVVLDVEGTVSADRRYVTMTVIVSNNKLIDMKLREITAVVGGELVQSGETGSFIELPIVQTSQVNTTVNVPDRGTIMLGGQTIRNEIEMESGVPVLSKIPLINRFFTNRLTSTEEKTLLILLKPTVIIQQENEERLFPGLQDSITGGAGSYGGVY